MPNSIYIDTPGDFSFRSTVYSHGWCELAPFELDAENWRLKYVFRDAEGKAVPAVIYEEKDRIRIDISGSKADAAGIIEDTRHLLRLDDDLSGLYDSIRGHDRLKWVGEKRAGRLLRSATVWEDLVKTICTTNCSWALTKNMVTNLVEKLGTPAGGKFGSYKAFPTAEAMASVTDGFYRNEIRAGYRSPYFVELAEAVAAGTLDPQSWLTSEL
ncbi:MAG: Fe-S cluster assembly protein HesB, partial [Acidobacteriota bacterium]